MEEEEEEEIHRLEMKKPSFIDRIKNKVDWTFNHHSSISFKFK